MSYNIDGKVANQSVLRRMDGRVICAKCYKAIKAPLKTTMNLAPNKTILVHHYVGSEHFIHETKKGHAVVYCSNYCMKSHNHRY